MGGVSAQQLPFLGLSGEVGEKVFAWAQQHRALIVTFDEDFSGAWVGRTFSPILLLPMHQK